MPGASLPPRIGVPRLSGYYSGMIYLASQSPRRAALLRQIGVEHEVYVSNIDESRLASESPQEYVCRMATSKARVAFSELVKKQDCCVVLAADTTIELDGDIIGKPADRSHCHCILKKLSGRQHHVLTAVALATTEQLESTDHQPGALQESVTSGDRSLLCQCGTDG